MNAISRIPAPIVTTALALILTTATQADEISAARTEKSAFARDCTAIASLQGGAEFQRQIAYDACLVELKRLDTMGLVLSNPAS